ncbi:galactokinase family protein [Pyrobaculum arsenaticum]|uniref:Galactokinase n=1 Tax=Pyrobaculum arsenaticum TaxID=121277 RepID=A0A7L4PBC3_9CREN|nr:galactokinase family protein [Pyrobaculum arsenaticum]NYR15914.1 galactokinase [Pyrobaculum arsenaticum]
MAPHDSGGGVVGVEALVKASAPGRLDFLNTHQDYKGLPVVSVAVDLRTTVTLRRGEEFEITSLNTGERCHFSKPLIEGRSFCDYVKAAVISVEREGVVLRGFSGELYSDIPIGAGMASSAAMLVALVGAMLRLAGRGADLYTVAELAYRAEREVLGVPCGRLDQYGSAFGKVAVIYPKPPVRVERLEMRGGVFVVLDSGIRHSTAEIHPKRQAELQEAVEILREALGVESEGYWDFPWEVLEARRGVVETLPQPLRDRVLFTLEMQKSTERALAYLRGADVDKALREVGREMLYQHHLLSRLYEVSLPKLDQLVEEAVAAGAYGAKLSGAGLGGVVIALAPNREVAERVGQLSSAERWWVVEIDEGLRYGD